MKLITTSRRHAHGWPFLIAVLAWAMGLPILVCQAVVTLDVAFASICPAEAVNNQCSVVGVGTGRDNMCYFEEPDMKANQEEASTKKPITTVGGDNPPADSPQDEPQPSNVKIDVDEAWDDIAVFEDQYGDPCAFVRVAKPSPHREFMRLRDKRFRMQMLRRYVDKHGTMPKKSFLNEAVQFNELEASESVPLTVHNRFARQDGAVWFDLGDRCWHRIRIDEYGWEVVESDIGPVFERHKHHESLPMPEQGGSMGQVLRCVDGRTIATDAISDSELLIAAWMMSASLQIGPTPIMVYSAPMGSAKSTWTDLLRSLLDPSKAPLQGESTRRDLPLTLWHNAMPAFDNITKLTKAESDSICRAVTGTGQDRRKLHSDTGEIILKYRRPIIMTTIGLPSLEPDFLDRCIVLHGQRLTQFRSEGALHADFKRNRPRFFGAILDLLVRVIGLLPSEPETGEFRMADYARCGRATARALGVPADRFEEAYRRACENQNDYIIDSSEVAQAIILLCQDGPWTGTAEELRLRLRSIGRGAGMSMSASAWPANAQQLAMMLDELAPSLAAQNVEAKRLRRRKDTRPWYIAPASEHE